jgi:hypothetical protein
MKVAGYWAAKTIYGESMIDLADRLQRMAHTGETEQRSVALREAARRLRVCATFRPKEKKEEK